MFIRYCLVLPLLLLMPQAAVAQQSGTSAPPSLPGYPNEDYFWTHSREQSWEAINNSAKIAASRLDGEQRKLDEEKARRDAQTRGDAAQRAVTDWYSAECRKIGEKRAREYANKEECQRRLNHFYALQFERENSPDRSIRDAYQQERRKAEKQEQNRRETAAAGRRREAYDPVGDDYGIEQREAPELVNAPVARVLQEWEKELERHEAAESRLTSELSRELRIHLLNRDRWKGDVQKTQQENQRHAAERARLQHQLENELARFNAAWNRVGPR